MAADLINDAMRRAKQAAAIAGIFATKKALRRLLTLPKPAMRDIEKRLKRHQLRNHCKI